MRGNEGKGESSKFGEGMQGHLTAGKGRCSV